MSFHTILTHHTDVILCHTHVIQCLTHVISYHTHPPYYVILTSYHVILMSSRVIPYHTVSSHSIFIGRDVAPALLYPIIQDVHLKVQLAPAIVYNQV